MAISKREQVSHFLVVEDLKGKRTLPLEVATYSVGRAPHNSIVLHAPSISRQHAMILRVTVSEDDRYSFRIVDGNLNGKRSTNGVFVNGSRCFSHDLKDGDVIKFGDRVQAQYLIEANPSTLFGNEASTHFENVPQPQLNLQSQPQPQAEKPSSNKFNPFQTIVASDDRHSQDAASSGIPAAEPQIQMPVGHNDKIESETGVDRFLEIISNRLRTSSNAIIGTTRQLLDTELSAQQQLYAQTVLSNSEALLNTIHNLLDLTKIDSGKLELEKYPFQLHQCIEEVVNRLNPAATAKNLKLGFSIDAKVPTTIIGDANRLRQILVNLIDNGINFTDSGEINLSITAKEVGLTQSKQRELDCSAPIYQLHFSIQDTGIGIAPELKQDLFQFNQLKALPTTGLALSKQLTEMMQGQIWVESQGRVYGNPPLDWHSQSPYTTGSTFHFTILAQADAASINKLSIPKILLVEDCRVNQQVIMLMLESLGYQADVVKTGLEATEAWNQASYDIVLMDVEMPTMNGLSATFHIRQQTLSSHYPYIIAITASTAPDTKQKCLQAGMNNYISKPFTKTKLKQVLQQALTRLSAKTLLDQAASSFDSESTNDSYKSPLDYRVLESIRQMGGEKANRVLCKIIKNFLEDTPEKLQAIKKAVDTCNPQALRQLAHNLKSSSANLGAVNFSCLCKQLENLGRSGTTEGGIQQLGKLQEEYEQLQQALSLEYQNMCSQLT